MNLLKITNELSTKSPGEQVGLLTQISNSIHNICASELEAAINSTESPFVKNFLSSLLNKKRASITFTEEKSNTIKVNDIDIDAIKSEVFSETIGQFLHELNPIIGAINLHTQKEIPEFQKSETYNDLKYLDEVIETFEDWMKVEQAARYKKILVSDALDQEIDILNKQYSIEIINKISKSLEVVTDKALFRIIVSNALRNSIQATEPGSYSSSPILINGGYTDRELWLSIIDNGCGIKESKEEIVKSRYSTKPGNKGLGLTILNKAVSVLNGRWEIKNGVARGTEFHLELPIREL